MLTSFEAVRMLNALMDYYVTRVSSAHALTPSIVHNMLEDSDMPEDVAAAWWVASKFEDVFFLTITEIQQCAARAMLTEPLTDAVLKDAETKMLNRIQFNVPYKSVVRDIINSDPKMPGLSTEMLNRWCYILLDSQAFQKHPDVPASTWISILTERMNGEAEEFYFWCKHSRALIVKNFDKVFATSTSKKTPRPDETTCIDLTGASPPPAPKAAKRSKVVIDLMTPVH